MLISENSKSNSKPLLAQLKINILSRYRVSHILFAILILVGLSKLDKMCRTTSTRFALPRYLVFPDRWWAGRSAARAPASPVQHIWPGWQQCDRTPSNMLLFFTMFFTIEAIGHRGLKKCWLMVMGCVLYTAGKLSRPAYFGRTAQLLPRHVHVPVYILLLSLCRVGCLMFTVNIF